MHHPLCSEERDVCPGCVLDDAAGFAACES